MKQFKMIVPMIILAAAIAASYALPKPKYHSLNILSQLNIPEDIGPWKGTDVSGKLDLGDERYRFISGIFAHTYERSDGPNLMLLILDAGNFHNPKVCFGSSGYAIKELPDTEISLGPRTFKAVTLLMSKGQENTVLIYWLCLDKQVSSWAGQKVKEFWTSLVGKKKAGLMVRLDIPASPQAPEQSVKMAKQFLADLYTSLDTTQADYIFGK